jgi:hypothetical protein
MNAPPKTNPIHDLLSFLIAEKYKEPLNKPTIVKPETVSTGTSTEAVSTGTTEPVTRPSPAISRFSDNLAVLEKARRFSIDSTISDSTDPSNVPIPKVVRLTPEERQGGGGGFLDTSIPEPPALKAARAKRGHSKPTTGPIANILSTLQEIPEQEAGAVGNVDFQ